MKPTPDTGTIATIIELGISLIFISLFVLALLPPKWHVVIWNHLIGKGKSRTPE